jgi:hypothetical protein
MKIAKEMREEGNAQLTVQAKYGDFTNAEEKEELALQKQQEVLDLFASTYPQLVQQTPVVSVYDKGIVETEAIQHIEMSSNLEINSSEVLNNQLFVIFQEAMNFKVTAKELRKNAEVAAPNEKQILINEAISFENDYLVKELEISNIKAKMTYTKFSKNRELIHTLSENVEGNVELIVKVNQLNVEAEYLLKVGKEMREEGNAQLTVQAKYGAMSNAEEKEVLAINKQYESIQLIEKNSSTMVIASR